MKKASLALLLTLISSTALAQKYDIVGTIIEKGSNVAVPSASVRVLSLPDSSMVSGASSATNGSFKIQNVKKGKYAIKVTFVGYQDQVISLDLTNKKDKTVNLGNLEIIENSKLLKDAVVSAMAAKVQVSGDSLVYNASAYRVPEGSTLEALVKQLPGAELDGDGNIKINGKTIKKILVDKKEFFLDDKEMALKNLPTNIVDKIKAYDRKSDFSRVTGIDDGEDETVLDLQLKKGMAEGWMGNLDLALGTDHRYSGNMFARRALTNAQHTLIGNANNIGGRGFGGGGGRGGGWGRGGNGLTAMKNLGYNFATASDKLETGGSVSFRYNGNDSYQMTNSQNMMGDKSSFSNSITRGMTSNIGINGNLRFEWKPDSMTNIIFRPNVSYSRNRGMNRSNDASFDDASELDAEERLAYADQYVLDSLVLNIMNTSKNFSQSWSENKNLNGELQINRRLNNSGRNLTFRFTGGLTDNISKQLASNSTKYGFGLDSLNNIYKRGNDYFTNRYTYTPNKSHNYSAQVTYSEPIAERTYLQFSYRFNYSYSKNDRQAGIYAEDLTTYNTLSQALQMHRYNIAGAMDYMLSNGLSTNYDAITDSIANRQSQYSEYRNYNQTIGVNIRKITDMYNLSVGIELLPQHSTLNYKYMGKEYPNVKRTVYNIAPNLDFRYNFDKQTQFRASYRGRTSQPSMENLLDIEDDSNKSNIRRGNPGLKPSFSHTLQMNYNTYNADLQQGIFGFGNVSLTQNSISNEVQMDIKSGNKITKPENINGNWNGMIGIGYNRGLGEKKYFTVNTMTMFNYTHNVGYYWVDSTQQKSLFLQYNLKEPTSLKQKTNNMGIRENLSLAFRKNWFEMSVNGSVSYTHATTNMGQVTSPNTWDYSFGTEINLIFDNGFTLSTDISESCRRGYQTASMNTNEFLWNAQIGYSFLKGKALSITAQWNDILGNQSAISRAITAYSSSDSRTNAIYSYGMIHVIYRLNIFGKGGFNGFGGFGGGRPGAGGGRPAGGFTGARPGGFGGRR